MWVDQELLLDGNYCVLELSLWITGLSYKAMCLWSELYTKLSSERKAVLWIDQFHTSQPVSPDM